jgi:hypothetical protein
MNKASVPFNKFVSPGRVREVNGSITSPEHVRLAILFVPCSVSGEYKSDLYDKVATRWTKVRQDYRERFVNRENFKLGELINTAVASDVWVIQALCLNEKGKLDKDALTTCVDKVVALAKYERAYIHASQLSLTAFPAMKKVLPAAINPEGLNLYVYSDVESELVRR